MREILFRGKTASGNWIEGDLFINSANGLNLTYIRYPTNYINHSRAKVMPETVGQYTGLTDKNGNKIFEGDIIRVDDTENAVVEYDETSAFYMVVFDRAECDFGSLIEQYPNVEIIGNIHDNPELLKGE